jgi:hypothetical protein
MDVHGLQAGFAILGYDAYVSSNSRTSANSCIHRGPEIGFFEA